MNGVEKCIKRESHGAEFNSRDLGQAVPRGACEAYNGCLE